ncbi:MAG TPA: ABC transporter permease [Erysipelotrichaceae bacterium]|jgi:putative ABC transport system permease protein|nr:ABC transporter permease [Erysipelotrichia bacterium]HPX33203.1 ABC transporter permease [Erysipelotrichaceae bacterium]HQA85679.1 ABC transporter permease [Erysipelotrichaceae bacterium]
MITLSNLLYRLPGGVAQGLIWGIMALGIYITFRVLSVSDLTVDGSFTTGGAVTIMCILAGVNPILALLISFLVGILTGVVTGLIHTKLKIPAILAGILVQFGLYSINLHIMNMSANVSANPDRFNLLISMRDVPNAILIGIILSIVHIIVLYWYFGTEQGSAIRATGNNNNMALAQGININNMKVIGFGIGNGIVALAGGLMAQYQGFADINMGRGAIVIGLAAIIIGEVVINFIFKKGCSFYTRLASVIIGGIIYYAAMVFILWLRIDSNDLKLFTAIIVTIFLAIPNLNIKKGGKQNVKN